MAEVGAAVVSAGAALSAAVYTATTGFVARHENTHSLQVTEIRRHITDFEIAYGRGEVTEHDWHQYRAIREEAQRKESEYEESIEAYKETPMYQFFVKWRRKRQVREKKKALRRANKLLRSHYYESTSAASDTSSVTAESGSPPRGHRTHSDEDDERISSRAEDVANEKLAQSRKESYHQQRVEAEFRRRDELREGYALLKDVLPDSNQKVTKLLLLDRACHYIPMLEKTEKDLRTRVARSESKLDRLYLPNEKFASGNNSPHPHILEGNVTSSSSSLDLPEEHTFSLSSSRGRGGRYNTHRSEKDDTDVKETLPRPVGRELVRDELSDAYIRLRDVLPSSNQKFSKYSLLQRARAHILSLEKAIEILQTRAVDIEGHIQHDGTHEREVVEEHKDGFSSSDGY